MARRPTESQPGKTDTKSQQIARHQSSGLLSHLLRALAGAGAIGVSLRGFAAADRTPAQPAGTQPRRTESVQPRPSTRQNPKSPVVPLSPVRDGMVPARNDVKTSAAPVKLEGGWLALLKELWDRFNKDEDFMRASALAFVIVLSLVPVLLVGLAALGFFIRDPQQAANYVQQLIVRALPGQQASKAANDVIKETNIVAAARGLMEGRIWSAIIGILSLLWTAISLFVTAADAMNAAWEVKETRGFLQLRLLCLGVFAGAGLLFLCSLIPTSGPDVIRSLHIPGLALPQPVPYAIDLLFVLLAWVIDIAMFIWIYKLLPNAKVSWKAAAVAGVITGLFWELFKKGFALYLAYFGNFNKLYGTLGGLMLLVTWIYYSCVLLLAGATIAKMYLEHTEEGGIVKRDTVST